MWYSVHDFVYILFLRLVYASESGGEGMCNDVRN